MKKNFPPWIIELKVKELPGYNDVCPVCSTPIMDKTRAIYIAIDSLRDLQTGYYEWCCSHTCAERFILGNL